MNQMNAPETPLKLVRRLIDLLEKFEPHIRKALSYGGDSQTFEQICQDVLSGRMHVHSLPNAILICETSKYAGGLAYNVVIAAGDLDEILEFQRLPLIRAARARKCNALSFTGRPGWKRALEDEGWKLLSITMAMEI